MHTNAAPPLTTPRALAILILLPLLFHLPELLGWLQTDPQLVGSGLGINLRQGVLPGNPGWLDPNSLWTTEWLGHLAAEQWLAGHVPWWNAYSGLGAPLAAEMQPAALFLPFILLMHFGSGLILMRIAMQVIAGLGTWQLLRSLRLHPAAMLIGAVLFEFCGAICWFSHGPDRVAAFLPWLILAIELCRTQPLPGAGLFALALAGSIYAGFPESAYINGLLALIWFALRLFQTPHAKPRLAASVIGGGLCGLLLAAPVIWPFIQYLRLAEIGIHGGSAAWITLPPSGLAMLLLPYIVGPIASFNAGKGDIMFAVWGNAGGYLGAAVVALALMGLVGKRREAALRWVLLAWIVLILGKSAGVPGLVQTMNQIPLINQTAFGRYMQAALSLAATVIGALAIDDWLAGADRQRRATALIAVILGVTLTAGALIASRPAILALLPNPRYRPFPIASAAWCLAVVIALPMLMSGKASQLKVRLLGCLILADALGMAGLTLLSNTRGRLDPTLVDFLGSRPGINRVLAIGGSLGLNEGARYGFATINETMLPAPLSLGRLLHNSIHPAGDAISFPDTDMTIDRVIADLSSYQAMGVTLLVTSRTSGPAHGTETAPAKGSRRALILDRGQSISGTLPAGLITNPIDQIAVDIGTYSGASDGSLHLSLCRARDCAEGTAALPGAADNAPLDIKLGPELQQGDGPYRWLLRHDGGSHPVAIWMSNSSRAPTDGQPDGPRFSMRRTWQGFDPPLVFTSKNAEVYQMPNPAPYFEAPGCTISAASRTSATTDCASASTLLRRELFFPGWTAKINGVPETVSETDAFQSIPLPRGHAKITFSYAPPHIIWAWLAAFAALLATLAALLVPLSRPSKPLCRPYSPAAPPAP